ncbi:MAG: hypothetical protein ACOVLE_13210, partial [Pirellula staleyi]
PSASRPVKVGAWHLLFCSCNGTAERACYFCRLCPYCSCDTFGGKRFQNDKQRVGGHLTLACRVA